MSRRSEQQAGTDARFWVASALAHLLIIGLVLQLPVRKIFFGRDQRPEAEIIRKGEDLAEVVDDIRDLAAERLKAQVELLAAGQDRMAGNFDTLNAFNQRFVANQRETARARLEQQVTGLFALQDELLAAMERGAALGERASDPMWRVYAKTRARITVGQEEMSRALLLLAAEQEPLLADLHRAEEEQSAAMAQLQSSVSAQNRLWRDSGTQKKYSSAIPELEARINAGHKSLSEAEQTLKTMQQGLQGAADEAAKRRARKEVDDQQRRLKRHRDLLEKDEGRLAAMQAEAQAIGERRPVLVQKRDDCARAAVAHQQEACRLQRAVFDELCGLLDAQAEIPTDAPSDEGSSAPVDEPAPSVR